MALDTYPPWYQTLQTSHWIMKLSESNGWPHEQLVIGNSIVVIVCYVFLGELDIQSTQPFEKFACGAEPRATPRVISLYNTQLRLCPRCVYLLCRHKIKARFWRASRPAAAGDLCADISMYNTLGWIFTFGRRFLRYLNNRMNGREMLGRLSISQFFIQTISFILYRYK